MDIVLEVFDTFIGDRMYSALYPNPLAKSGFSTSPNATYTGFDAPAISTWQYKPASSYISIPPSEYAYLSGWARDDPIRQFISLFLITWLFGNVIYFVFATFSYVFIFDKSTFNHPKYLKNQMRKEIAQSCKAFPLMAFFTAPLFLLECRGYSKIYDSTADGPGTWYNYAQFPLFIMFTDFCIYWIHRWLHHPLIYKHLHKPHHKWIMPTPYASHAFHFLDGYAQGLPYHIFPFLFPLQKFAYIFLFTFINIWTVMIHDGEYIAESPIINGAACHTMHHLYFNYNYGQFTTLWDRIGNSYRKPNDELFRKELKMCQTEWKKQVAEMETIQKQVEGEDDREYDEGTAAAGAKKTQ